MEKFGFDKIIGGGSNHSPSIHRSIPKPQPPKEIVQRKLLVTNCPNNNYAIANVAAVNSQDFADGEYISIDNIFVFTAKVSDVPPGHIGFNGNQRQWGKWGLDQPVIARTFDIFHYAGSNAYLGSLDIDIQFRNKARATQTPFDQDELAKEFLKKFQNQVMQPTQNLLFEFKSVIFTLCVKSVASIDLGGTNLQSASSSNISSKGILISDTIINFHPGADGLVNLKAAPGRARPNPIVAPNFQLNDLGIGGLDDEFQKIFRRAFASRIIPYDLAERLNVRHVKGLLLYGPPGTGKTLIARQISKMLNVKEPKIVNGPEMLSKYVGSSEENIRNLFKDAEAEYKSKGDASQLHIIIFDELDSVFKQRGSKGDGTGVGDNVVNQLLAKMDGVEQLNNILVIGMTNRLDLIDNALLRPGRFEVQIEISLPDTKGRKDIIKIHTKKMVENKILDKDVNFDELAELTKNFTGAELEGLVNSATSFAINKHTKGGTVAEFDAKSINKMKIVREDFLNALTEVKPAFGVNEDDLKNCTPNGIVKFSKYIDEVFKIGAAYSESVKVSETERLSTILLYGPSGSGKTAIAASMALNSGFPFIKLLSPESIVGLSEPAKIQYIDNTFRDVHKSPLSILVIDNIERLLNYVSIGPRFSNEILQILAVNITRRPPHNRRLLVIATTSNYQLMKQMDLLSIFSEKISIPNVTKLSELNQIMIQTNFKSEKERGEILAELQQALTTDSERFSIGIKKILSILDIAKHQNWDVNDVVLAVTGALIH